MKTILILMILFTLQLVSCGPPVEKRERMDAIARRTADSIQIYIDSALRDPINELAKLQ